MMIDSSDTSRLALYHLYIAHSFAIERRWDDANGAAALALSLDPDHTDEAQRLMHDLMPTPDDVEP